MTEVPGALRAGALLVAGVLLLVLYRPTALDPAAALLVPDMNLGAYLASTAVWAVTGGLLLARRLSAKVAAPLLVTTLVVTAAASAAVPPDLHHTSINWAFAANGWIVLVLALGWPTWRLVAVLAIPPGLAVLLTVGNADAVPVLGRAVGVLGPQVLVALAATRLRRAAETAAALLREQQAARTAWEIGTALHDDRITRARNVSAIVEPVLADLAALQATDAPGEALRRRCAIAAAQVRRLLSEWHLSGPGPLGDEFDRRLDELQRTGVQIDVAVRGRGQAEVPGELARLVGDHALAAVGCARRHARVTVHLGDDLLRVSVVADAPPGAADAVRARIPAVGGGGTFRTSVHETSGGLWLETTCRLR